MISLPIRIILCIIEAIVVFAPMIAASIWSSNKRLFLESNEKCYIISEPHSTFNISVICALLYYLVTAALLLTSYADVAVCFLPFVLLGECSCLVSQLWWIKVEEDVITVYRFPLRPKKIRYSEITDIRCVEKINSLHIEGKMKIIACHNNKKLFKIGSNMTNSEYLFERLAADKKIEYAYHKENGLEKMEVKEAFVVEETTADRVRSGFGLVFFSVMLVISIISFDELYESEEGILFLIIVYLLFGLLTIFLARDFIRDMCKRITVNYRTITVRSAVGKVITFDMSDITSVFENDNYIILFVNYKKTVQVYKHEKNFALLAARLLEEQKLQRANENV